MTTIEFNIAEFRIRFPEFSDVLKFPDVRLEFFWFEATCLISDQDCGRLTGKCRELAIQLLTAHIAKLSEEEAEGGGIVQSATIDKVSVTLKYPEFRTQSQWWFYQTPYGSQYYTMLIIRSIGGWNVGGRPVSSGFRKENGSF